MRRGDHQRTAVWLWAACVLLAAGAGGALAGSDAENPVEPFALRPVAVETLGFAPMGPGVSEGEAYSAALANARRNALIQAHAALQAETLVANRRVAEEVVRVRSAGYVQEMHVLDSGVVPGSEPPVYRVRVRALVHPLEKARVGAAAAVETQLTPVLVLDVASVEGIPLRDALAQELTRCGMCVVEASGGVPAIAVHVAALETVELSEPGSVWWQSALRGPGTSALKASWHMSAERADDFAAPLASGQCLLPADAEALARVLPYLSVTMAQAALRVWCAPRATRVLFRGATEAEAHALRAAARDLALPEKGAAEPPDGGTLLNLRVAGSPSMAVESILERAGLKGLFVISEAGLTELTCVRAPEPAAAEANAP